MHYKLCGYVPQYARKYESVRLTPLGTKEMLELAQRLVAIAEKYHIIVESCAEKINLEQFGIAHGHCIDCDCLKNYWDVN